MAHDGAVDRAHQQIGQFGSTLLPVTQCCGRYQLLRQHSSGGKLGLFHFSTFSMVLHDMYL